MHATEVSVERRLFALAVVLTMTPTLVALASHRYPIGPDTVDAMVLSWAFQNGLHGAGELPQWSPYNAHGDVTIFPYLLTAGLFQSIQLLFGRLVLPDAFLGSFAVGMFVDEAVLLVGTWLLARRLLSPAATFLVAVSTVLPCYGHANLAWNLRLVSELPLVLALAHRFLESGQARYAAAATTVYLTTALGGLAYSLPLTSLFLAAWLGTWALTPTGRRELGTRSATTWVRGMLCGCAAGIPAAGALAALVAAARRHSVVLAPDRSEDGTVALDTFLHAGGTFNWAQWLEALTGWSDTFELALYSGFLVVVLALVGVPRAARRSPQVLVALVVLTAFMASDAIATALYHVWPGMDYYRYRTNAYVLPRVLVVLLAGFGWDTVFGRTRVDREAAWLAAGTCAAGALALYVLRFVPASALMSWFVFHHDANQRSPEALLAIADAGGILGAFFALVCAVLALGRASPMVSAALLMIGQVGELVAYRGLQQDRWTRHADAPTHALFAFRPLEPPTSRHRTEPEEPTRVSRFVPRPALPQFPERDERLATLARFLVLPTEQDSEFAMVFQTGANARVNNWTRSLHTLVAIESGESLTAPGNAWARETVVGSTDFRLPRGPNESAWEISGASGMLQVHREAVLLGSDGDAIAPLRDPTQTGHVLYVLGTGDGTARPGDDTRVPVAFAIDAFSANELRLHVADAPAGSWLYWADAWHPDWSATVDGHDVRVHRANVAYKAVPLPGGSSEVRFRFGVAWFGWVVAFFGLHATAVVAAVLAAGVRLLQGAAPPIRTGRELA